MSEPDGGSVDGLADGISDGQGDGLGDGDRPQGDGDDGGPIDAGECQVAPALPLGLQVGDEPWPAPPGGLREEGEAWVLLVRDGPEPEKGEVWLFFPEVGRVVKLVTSLPHAYRLPVRAGQKVWAKAIMEGPWWINHSLELRQGTASGPLFALMLDGSFPWGEVDDCPPEEDHMGCGMLVYPYATLESDGEPEGVIVRQGDLAGLSRGQHLIKVMVGRFTKYVEMWCDDVPDFWIQSALLGNHRRSQCHCRDDADCAQDLLCDPSSGHCVVNACVRDGIVCSPNQVCDPFRAECQEQILGVWCASNDDCADDAVCNPLTGVCLEDICPWVNCAPCSPLLGRCYQCLHDCDCPFGLCDVRSESCVPGCDPDVMEFTRENPDGYDLAFACLDERLPLPEELVTQILPEMRCGGVSSPAGCDPDTQTTCLVELQLVSTGSLAVEREQWFALCALSRLPVVSRIHGSYFMDR